MKVQNNRIQQILICIPAFILITQTALFPCTVAVVSGKATQDGRPLLWKNRDASVVDNKIIHIQGKKYSFIGIINAGDRNAEHVWAGINTEGFAIMNSASRDLAQGEEGMNDNGRFMKLALGECADVSDFEKFLEITNNKRKVGANFGVIDARGNACFFETRSSSFVKFDANDPLVAPQGYIVRTNYAFTAPIKNAGGGYIRFERASKLFRDAAKEKRLNFKFILQKAARDLVNEKLHSYPLSKPKVHDASASFYTNTNDTINRNSTVSVALFHGALNPDKAYLSTMWILLGQPVCTVAVPLWAHAGEVPEMLSGPNTAPLNDFSRAIASYLYPDKRGHMKQYLNVSKLLNYRGDGVLKRLFQIENQVFVKTKTAITEWKKKKPRREDMFAFSDKVTSWVYESLKDSFPDIKTID